MFIAKEKELQPKLEKIINSIILKPAQHARWLNLLSYLEFIGSRKIFRTQNTGHVDEQILKHASDEARHAYYLKQMVRQLDGSGNYDLYQKDNMLASYSGYRYIQSLDALVKRRVKKNSSDGSTDNSYICYVYVSYIVEVRANWLYAIYSDLLKKNQSKINISMIISDEVRHLAEMKGEIEKLDPDYATNIGYFLQKEDQFFGRLLASLDSVLSEQKS